MAIETLRPTEVNIKIFRGTDNTYVFTVLNPNGTPKDMSQYAGLAPQIRFSSHSQSNGGVIPGEFAQAQLASGGLVGLSMCEWLAGGVGGQIHVVIPELDLSTSPIVRGSKNATNTPNTGKFDIQVRTATGVINLTSIGGPGAYDIVNRAVTGNWTIDTEVTGIP